MDGELSSGARSLSEKKIDPFDPLTQAAINALQAFEEYEAGRKLYSFCLLEKAARNARRGLGVESCADLERMRDK